mmetsp:Transcript_12460/g.28863  ORF Transcript_12460/g.28863 Transcript_12460/m.28863 type:complete len:173 (+) Transcript_12460:165-683(+)
MLQDPWVDVLRIVSLDQDVFLWTMASMLVASLVFLLLLFKESEGGFRSLFFSKKSADKEVCTDRMNWWDEDGAPPFVVTDAKEQARNREIIDAYNRLGPHVTHFCFLVHGHRGFRKVNWHGLCVNNEVETRSSPILFHIFPLFFSGPFLSTHSHGTVGGPEEIVACRTVIIE